MEGKENVGNLGCDTVKEGWGLCGGRVMRIKASEENQRKS
jgi:hypothetical protein